MISKRGVKFWDICLKMIATKATQQPYTKGRRVLTLTGPLMITHATSVAKDDICHLSSLFSSSTHKCGYIKELGGKSWHEADFQVYNFVVANYSKIIFAFVTFLLLTIIFVIIYAYHKRGLQ